ncbi:MAG: ABC transporter substrate-binding protein [Alphaproteobacteria bacterium]|nr:ABC transporter substrate-binding protein [Alphaproteobacteria bacterium]
MIRSVSTTRRTALAAGVALAALLAAAPPAAAQRNVIAGGFDVGPGGFQGNFNPLAASAGFTWLTTYYEPLIVYDAKLERTAPALAASWTVSADKLTYTFKLAPGAKWHDGRPFTSADVKFTMGLAKEPKTGSVFAARFASVKEVKTPDDTTAVIELSQPNASLMDGLTKLMMLPAHALSAIPVDALAKHEWWSKSPVGTGAFKFVKYETDQYVELAANAEYRGGKPKVDGLINRYFKTTASAAAALKAGEIQVSYVEVDDARTFQGNAAFKVVEGDSYVVNYLGFNHDAPLWKDARVRQAVMHALDRNAIIQSLYAGAAKPANCAYVADHLVPAGVEPYAYNPDKARQLLREANWAQINGAKPFTLLTYYNSPQAMNVMAAMQAMLGQVGINVVPKAVDVPAYNATVYAQNPDWNNYPIVYAGIQIGPDASNINIALNEKQIPPAGANVARVRDAGVTAALDAALGETDDAKLAGRFQEVCRAMNKTVPWGTMWVAKRYGVVSTKLKDFTWLPAPAGGPYDQKPQAWSIGQ